MHCLPFSLSRSLSIFLSLSFSLLCVVCLLSLSLYSELHSTTVKLLKSELKTLNTRHTVALEIIGEKEQEVQGSAGHACGFKAR